MRRASRRRRRGLQPALHIHFIPLPSHFTQVVHTVSTSTIEKQAVYCRCWRSGTFPLCNGAHVAHNKETGDNVGPLIIKKE